MADLLLNGVNLIKDYGTVVKTRALRGVNLALQEGEFASIIGPSGCGKSTLLNLFGALDKPTTGSLYFKDRDFTTMNEEELAQFRNRNIGFIFQFHHLLPEFTALENILLPSWIESGIADRRKEVRGKELLETVGLLEKSETRSGNLSGGQQQRISIARALINDPDLVLADEPTGNLDSESTEQIYALLRKINRELGMAFLIVTHDRHIAEKSDRIIEMKDGSIISDYNTKDYPPDALWGKIAPACCKFGQDGKGVNCDEYRVCVPDIGSAGS